MHILVTRPEADAAEFKARLEALGHRVTVDPLMRIVSCAPASLYCAKSGAVVATSRNALRAIADHPALPSLVELPLYVVGPGTAAMARGLGFGEIVTGPATAADLVEPIAAAAPAGGVLHLRGEKIAFDLKTALAGRGVAVAEAVVYRQVAAERLSAETVSALAGRNLDIAVLMSPLTAQTYVSLVDAAGLGDAAGAVRYACLSAGIAEKMASLPAETAVASKPRAEEMLALVVAMAEQSAASAEAPKPRARIKDRDQGTVS